MFLFIGVLGLLGFWKFFIEVLGVSEFWLIDLRFCIVIVLFVDEIVCFLFFGLYLISDVFCV